MRVCVITDLESGQEPRAPRIACAIARNWPEAHVQLIEHVHENGRQATVPQCLQEAGVEVKTRVLPARGFSTFKWATQKIASKILRALVPLGVGPSSVYVTLPFRGLGRMLSSLKPDLTIAHNIAMLPFASRTNGAVIFDNMEWYADMGPEQSGAERTAARIILRTMLSKCQRVIATSRVMAAALASEYDCKKVDVLVNAGPRPNHRVRKDEELHSNISLYWRNGTIGTGQRGLQVALEALAMLPEHYVLTIQGRSDELRRSKILAICDRLDIKNRVTIAEPYETGAAIEAAALHDIGLCLELHGPRNHYLTTSNKIYDYHLAGLAVVASRLDGLAEILEQSGAGLTFTPGDSLALAEAIVKLTRTDGALKKHKLRAWQFGQTVANEEEQVSQLLTSWQDIRESIQRNA